MNDVNDLTNQLDQMVPLVGWAAIIIGVGGMLLTLVVKASLRQKRRSVGYFAILVSLGVLALQAASHF